MSKLRYKPTLPPDVRKLVEPHLAELEWLIPAWMQQVFITYSDGKAPQEDEHNSVAMTTYVNHEYRWATITIYPDMVSSPEEGRREDIIHELIHLHTNPMADRANNVIRILMGDEQKALYNVQEDELTALHEAAVQDLAFIINGRLDAQSDSNT